MMKSRKTRALAVRILIADKGISLQRQLFNRNKRLLVPLKNSFQTTRFTTLQLSILTHQDNDGLKLAIAKNCCMVTKVSSESD